MVIKPTTNASGQSYYHLVESYRDNGSGRHRTLRSLGKAGEDRMDDLIAAIVRHKERFTVLELAKTISIDETFILGPLRVLERLFEKSGINAVLSEVAAQHPRLGFDLKKIAFTMITSRLITPGSKRKVSEHWQQRLDPEMIEQEIGLHQLSRALDVLADHKEEIEKHLYWHDRNLLNAQVDVVLYDLTTLRFESVREDIGLLRRFGYSKERRSDCTQVVLGLLVAPDGTPLGFAVYPGNTFEGKTVADIVQKMRGKFNVRPIFHWTDRRIIGHLTLGFLAYLCEALMTKGLREKNLMLESPAVEEETIQPRPLTVVEAMRELQEVKAIPVKVKSSTIWVRTDISGNANKLFSAIGLKAPPKVLQLERNQKCSGTRSESAHNQP